MQSFNITIGKNTYNVICEYWQTSHSWGHKVTVLKNGIEVSRAKIRYYNRTWESFTYQSCISQAIEYAKNQVITFITDNFKTVNGYKVLTAGRRADLAKVIAKDNQVKQYTLLYNKICAQRHAF